MSKSIYLSKMGKGSTRIARKALASEIEVLEFRHAVYDVKGCPGIVECARSKDIITELNK